MCSIYVNKTVDNVSKEIETDRQTEREEKCVKEMYINMIEVVLQKEKGKYLLNKQVEYPKNGRNAQRIPALIKHRRLDFHLR